MQQLRREHFRNYVKSLSAEQLDWLAKDLSYVAKTTPVVVAMHAQVFYPTTSGFKIDHDQVNTLRLFDILDGYTVRFVTGHTHKLFNVTPDAPIVDGHNFREYNPARYALRGGGPATSRPESTSEPTELRAATASGMSREPISNVSTNRPDGPKSTSSAATT